MEIVEAQHTDFELFFSYLKDQLSENGVGDVPLFQPLPKGQCDVSQELKLRFLQGNEVDQSDAAWRKLWLAKDESGRIKGHIDLRRHGDDSCLHRVLLGMGVHHSCRKQGVGSKLIEVVSQFCTASQTIDWIDLCVLSDNLPALNLYLKNGFVVIGEVTDQYRIDGESISETMMAKPIHQIHKSQAVT